MCGETVQDRDSMKKFATYVIGAAFAAFLVGCGGSEVAKTSQFRVVHASPDAPNVDIAVIGETILRDVPYRAVSSYQTKPAGTSRIQVRGAGSTTNVIDAAVYLDPAAKKTILAVGRVATIEPLVLMDDASAPAPGQIKLRLVHASPAAGNVDLYITAPGTDLATVDPNFRNVPFKANTGYVQVPAGSYRVRITPVGTKTVAIDTGTVNLVAGDVKTGVAIGEGTGARPLDAILLTDR